MNVIWRSVARGIEIIAARRDWRFRLESIGGLPEFEDSRTFGGLSLGHPAIVANPRALAMGLDRLQARIVDDNCVFVLLYCYN